MIQRNCWCGDSEFKKYSPEYNLCVSCGTLVCSEIDPEASSRIMEDESGFYGKSYWFEHQTGQLGLPDLVARSRSDLVGRSLYWLKSLLMYCLPPAKTLELGSAHGGIVSLLQRAGFVASGLELSPWVVNYAQESFNVPMHLGPIEDQEIEVGSQDLIVMMDVLEHLVDPVTTLRECLKRLKPDGLLLIQTPRFNRDVSYQQLVQKDKDFLSLLIPVEHTYLFSKESINTFLNRLGVKYINYLHPYFPYDMFLVASRAPLPANTRTEIEESLLATSQGRIVMALLDLSEKIEGLKADLFESEADRITRLKNIHNLQTLLAESEADRRSRLISLKSVEQALKESERDRSARLAVIHQLEDKIQGITKDRKELVALLQESERDRSARLAVIHEKEKEISEINQARAALEASLQNSENDRAARLEVIKGLEEKIKSVQAERDHLEIRGRELEQQLQEIKGTFQEKLELFQSFEDAKYQLEQNVLRLEEINKQKTQDIHRQAYYIARYEHDLSRFPVNFIRRIQDKIYREKSKLIANITSSYNKRKSRRLKKVAVDLTPILPGGENGGAKLLAITLVKQLSQDISPDCEYILLTSDDSHDELAWLEAPNVKRICVNHRLDRSLHDSTDSTVDRSDVPREKSDNLLKEVRHQIGVFLERNLPRSIYQKIYQLYRSEIKSPKTKNLLSDMGVDLLFCPFTAPLYYSPGISTVVVVHDLQFLAYPQFFTSDDVYHANYYFRRSCQLADRLICVSDFTKESVLGAVDISPDRVRTIHSSLFNPLSRVDGGKIKEKLKEYELFDGEYILYPANFWPHKNHEMLLTAFNLFLNRNPDSPLKLVLTGAPGERMELLREASRKMGLGTRVVFPGFVSDETLSGFYQGCLAMIFPSLFEGFGVPVIEAMDFGVPVLSSNQTSLPEVGLDAVHYFDPRKPEEISEAIEIIYKNEDYRKDLVGMGRKRVESFSDVNLWAGKFHRQFVEVTAQKRVLSNDIFGVYSDHWVGKEFDVTIREGVATRFLELNLLVPTWFPRESLRGRVSLNGSRIKVFRAVRGKRNVVRCPLPPTDSRIRISFARTVQPEQIGVGADTRTLSCQLTWCRLLTPEAAISIYEAGV